MTLPSEPSGPEMTREEVIADLECMFRGASAVDSHRDAAILRMAIEAIRREERLIEALCRVDEQLDYLRNLWGDESFTRALAEKVKAALKDQPPGA